MKSLKNVPARVRQGEVIINGIAVMAFLADFKDDGGIYVAEDIIKAACGGKNPSLTPQMFRNQNSQYLKELARVSGCGVDDLIGLRPDSRHWCRHQVAVQLARWISPKLAIAFDRLLIQFAKDRMAMAFDWVDKRADSKQVVFEFNRMIKEDIDTPSGRDDDVKYAMMHSAIQKPFNKALGGPSQTKAFKELNNVSSAMDAYDTTRLVAVSLARSTTTTNVRANKIRNLPDAVKVAGGHAQRINELVKQLCSEKYMT